MLKKLKELQKVLSSTANYFFNCIRYIKIGQNEKKYKKKQGREKKNLNGPVGTGKKYWIEKTDRAGSPNVNDSSIVVYIPSNT